MTPFLQFRVWLKRAPATERFGAAVIGVIVLALVALAVVPASQSGRSPVATSGNGAGPAASAGVTSGGVASAAHGSAPSGSSLPSQGIPVSGSTSVPGSPGGATGVGGVSGSGPANPLASGGSAGSGGSVIPGSASGSAACGTPGRTDQGVTATTINVDVDVADLAGQAGNNLVGIPSAQDEEAMFGAAIDAVNAAGGVWCRKLVPKYYTADALDPSSLQALCLQIVADHPFALLDDGLASPDGPTTPRDCPPSNHIPEFGSLAMSNAELKQFAPYLFGDTSSAEEIVNDWVLAANELHWFAGAVKIGLLEQDCIPDINGLVMSDLRRIGIPSSKVVTFDFGCPNEIPPPDQVEEAVLQFKTAGVTNVMDDGGVYESYFSKDAANQDYKPKYTVADQATVALWDNPNFGPDASNFSGALAITASQYGAENTPGTKFNTATAACDKAMAAKKEPPAEHSPDGFAGVACTLVSMLVTGAENAPALTRADLAQGLAAARTLSLPFPAGPANFAASAGQHGGGYWRADTWVTACDCFRVSVPAFTPSFAMPS